MSRDQGVRAVTVPAVAAGNAPTIIGSACRLYGWSLADAGAGVTVQTATSAFVAGASSTATLPAGASISGFDITVGSVSVASFITVTVTGGAGGTLTYTIPMNVAANAYNNFSMRYPQPITPANPAVGIAVTFTGNVNSPPGNIDVYGQSFQSVGQLLDGGQILGVSSPVAGGADTQWLADRGVYVGTGVAVKCLTGSISGCIYVMDGTDIPADGY